MSNAEIDSEDFAAHIQKGDIRNAVAEVMGETPIGIKLSKRLLIEFSLLKPVHQKLMMDWSHSPDMPLPIGDQKWYVEEIARHELAHIVVAKALGFSTGSVSLVLHSSDGSHQGTSDINLDCQTPSLSEVSAYLDRRVIVLLAGYIAESDDASVRNSCVNSPFTNKNAESDLQKALELIQIKSNIERVSHPNANDKILRSLVLRSSTIVETNFSVISALAQRFADRIEFYEQRIDWEGSEIDNQPEIQHILKAQLINHESYKNMTLASVFIT